jgi:predicted nucleotidyltransferase
MKYGLDESVIQQINKLLRMFTGIEKAILYGSRAKGNYKNGSDIDISLVGDNLNLQDVTQIYVEFDKLNLPYSADISIFSDISNPNLVDHINRVGIIMYEHEILA